MNNTDNQNVKEEVLNLIKEKVKKYELSNYQISKLSGLSDVGIAKILDGRSKNPSEKTIKKIQLAIETFEKQDQNPITLSTLNDKLDFIIERMRANDLELELMFEILKNSSNPEELKKIEDRAKNKNF
ncbi:hypothetical protein ABXT08_07125 [Chryseobacterium sp. NRRL B-14859]|uniref:hypothetical protein n=1 Tax=Chryseobacterium sp. NRRL B-14859 TaxID=1562763 RepID=UPI00339109DE